MSPCRVIVHEAIIFWDSFKVIFNSVLTRKFGGARVFEGREKFKLKIMITRWTHISVSFVCIYVSWFCFSFCFYLNLFAHSLFVHSFVCFCFVWGEGIGWSQDNLSKNYIDGERKKRRKRSLIMVQLMSWEEETLGIENEILKKPKAQALW